jgi:hypothetical protein
MASFTDLEKKWKETYLRHEEALKKLKEKYNNDENNHQFQTKKGELKCEMMHQLWRSMNSKTDNKEETLLNTLLTEKIFGRTDK